MNEWVKLCAKIHNNSWPPFSKYGHHYLSHLPAYPSSPELLTFTKTQLHCFLLQHRSSFWWLNSVSSWENHDKPLKVMPGKWLWQTPRVYFLIWEVGEITFISIRLLWGGDEVTCLWHFSLRLIQSRCSVDTAPLLWRVCAIPNGSDSCGILLRVSPSVPSWANLLVHYYTISSGYSLGSNIHSFLLKREHFMEPNHIELKTNQMKSFHVFGPNKPISLQELPSRHLSEDESPVYHEEHASSSAKHPELHVYLQAPHALPCLWVIVKAVPEPLSLPLHHPSNKTISFRILKASPPLKSPPQVAYLPL